MSVKIILTKPITAHGETLNELELREPTAKELRKSGAPFIVIERDNGNAATEFQLENAANLISELAAIPPTSVDTMSAPDFLRAVGALMRFFGASIPETSSIGAGS